MLALIGAIAIIGHGAPDWTCSADGYKIVHWSDQDGDVQTIYLLDRNKKVLFALRNHHSGLVDTKTEECHFWEPPRHKQISLLGKGSRAVIFSEWTGGAHASYAYYIWQLGRHPRCLLAFDKRNVMDGHGNDPVLDFHPVDLNHDGRKEIVSFFDGLGGWGWNSYGGIVPFVFEYWNGSYRNATSKYRGVLREWSDTARSDILSIDPKEGHVETSYREAGFRLYALGVLSHSTTTATAYLHRHLPRKQFLQVLDSRSEIKRILSKMDSRIHKVAPYAGKPFTMYPGAAAGIAPPSER